MQKIDLSVKSLIKKNLTFLLTRQLKARKIKIGIVNSEGIIQLLACKQICKIDLSISVWEIWACRYNVTMLFNGLRETPFLFQSFRFKKFTLWSVITYKPLRDFCNGLISISAW